jgi:copper(I)-binding protein
MGAAYLTIVNAGGEPDRLQTVTAAWAKSIELHETVRDGDLVSMREVESGLEVPAAGSIALEPGGRHLMLEDVRLPPAAQSAPLTLSFARAGSMLIEVHIDRSDF